MLKNYRTNRLFYMFDRPKIGELQPSHGHAGGILSVYTLASLSGRPFVDLFAAQTNVDVIFEVLIVAVGVIVAVVYTAALFSAFGALGDQAADG